MERCWIENRWKFFALYESESSAIPRRYFQAVPWKYFNNPVLFLSEIFLPKNYIKSTPRIDEFLREIETTATEYILTWFNLISLTSYIRRRRKNILTVGEISYFVRIRRTCKTLLHPLINTFGGNFIWGKWRRQNTYWIFFAEREQWHNVCSSEYRGGGASKSVIGKKFGASKRDFTTLSPAVDHSRSRKRDRLRDEHEHLSAWSQSRPITIYRKNA